MLGYVTLVALFLGLFLAIFYFGIREWLKPQDNTPLPVDVEYVRVENYFGTSFRAKMQEWMKTAQPHEEAQAWGPPVKTILEKSNHEKIIVISEGRFGGEDAVDSLIFCEGNLEAPDRSSFHREVYCRGNLKSGEGTRFQAVAADGEIVLGPYNDVSRWVDGRRTVRLGRGTVVNSRVSSAESIEMGPDSSVQSLFAPIVFTTGYRPGSILASSTELSAVIERAAPESPEEDEPLPPYLEGLRASRLANDTWIVQDDLELEPGDRVEGNIVVQGTLKSGEDCHFLGDVKAKNVQLGPGNRVHGSVVSAEAVDVGYSSVVGKSIAAETSILLQTGVRVGRPGAPVAISAGTDVRMEADVAVCGKLAAGRAVLTVE
jgi:predicted acyltransferase (DUF342 family)